MQLKEKKKVILSFIDKKKLCLLTIIYYVTPIGTETAFGIHLNSAFSQNQTIRN